VAVCVFLNMGISKAWIARELTVSTDVVELIAKNATPLLRRSRKARPEKDSCAYCGSPYELTRDHVTPRSRGGDNEPGNLVWACRNCNSAKGDRTPEEWLG